MSLIIRLLLLIPSLVTGWFVSREDPRFWIAALAVALMFFALSIIAGLYLPELRLWPFRRK